MNQQHCSADHIQKSILPDRKPGMGQQSGMDQHPDMDRQSGMDQQPDASGKKGILARSYFLEGYNCSQAVFLAFSEETGLDPQTAARLASSFGGGMGRLREVCGAVSGMLLAAGMLRGYDSPTDTAGKKAHYELVQKLAHEFSEKNGSIICRELLGLSQKSDAPAPAPRTGEYYKKRPCADLVAAAAAILEAELLT